LKLALCIQAYFLHQTLAFDVVLVVGVTSRLHRRRWECVWMLSNLSNHIRHLEQLPFAAAAYVCAAAQPRIRRRHRCRHIAVKSRYGELDNMDHLHLIRHKEQELALQHH